MHSPKTGSYANSAFQLYSVASERLMARIPDTVSFEEASVLPLSISTAAAGLYLPEYLGLPCPTPGSRTLAGTILIWGGASSVGATAIQLAAASGLRIVSTASTPNHELVRSLGASVVFNYRSDSLVENLVNELKKRELVGIFDAIAEEESFIPIKTTIEHLQKTVRVVSVLPYNHPTERFNPKFISSYGIAYPPNERISETIWGEFVTEGLVSGRLQAKPDPVIVGPGLEELQKALDLQKAGVSAKKLVITL
ncbi:Alcohol dehydrogenase superfamily, zinc-type [Penicillium occitanis (nom. inval.)]|nr:Alcohol dehydrogenase superfamily, zinc-type [Penicillium occitanis (nom. inval.)]PCG93533.1 hypothetical protein PENOC_087240 [Penicillium occitanis (nom. inval.)]